MEYAIKSDIRVIVVCNGCSDDTFDVASGYPGIECVTLEAPSKTAAMNEGDRLAGDNFPRFYCDADIRIDGASIDAMLKSLDRLDATVVGPATTFDSVHSSWLIRQYYSALGKPPVSEWFGERLVGRGIYGMNREARLRFDVFPEIIADDLFIESLFSSQEKRVCPAAHAFISVPRNALELIRSEMRVIAGNREHHSMMAAAAPVSRRSFPTFETIRRHVRHVGIKNIGSMAIYFSIGLATRLALTLRLAANRRIHWR
jgi:hypothetical protein